MYIHSDKNKTVNINQIERWLGAERVLALQNSVAGWPSAPIPIFDMPGLVRLAGDGNFVGNFEHGRFASAMDVLEQELKRSFHNLINRQDAQLNAGFASVDVALSRASTGFGQVRNYSKVGTTGVVGICSDSWMYAGTPAAGAVGGAAPGGTVHAGTDTGALSFAAPASGTNHLVGLDMGASVIQNSLMVTDRLFSVAKTINSTAAQAVTGVPTRYQSTVATDPDYIGGNFAYVAVNGTALAATAHNHTACTYLDQANAASTFPDAAGRSGAGVNQFDLGTQQFFMPYAAGDVGVKALTNIQTSVAVATGAMSFVIAHALGIMSFPILGTLPKNFLLGMNQAPRLFDGHCINAIELAKAATTATNYSGQVYTTSAAA